MAQIKTIYIPDELLAKVKAEDNFSGLVSRLLNEHYNKSKTLAEIKKEIAILEVQAEAEDKIKELEDGRKG